MSVANDLQERERKAGNAEDGLDPGQQAYDEQFNSIAKNEEDRDFDDIINANYGDDASDTKVDAHGDTVQRNYNADPGGNREDLKNQEENPDSPDNSSPLPTKRGIWGKLANGSKRFGPSGGIIGLLMFGIVGLGGGSSFIASSVLINIKEIFHSDRADSTRTNQLFSRGFMASKFSSKRVSCDVKTPICRQMTSASTKEVYAHEDNGFKIKGDIVDKDGKVIGTYESIDKNADKDTQLKQSEGNNKLIDASNRLRINTITYPDGTVVSNGKDYYGHADRNPNALRRAENAFNSRSAFYLNTFFNDMLKEKWNFAKGAKKFPAPDTDNNDPNNQQSTENNQDKVFNQEANTVHVEPGTNPNDTNNPLRDRSDRIINDVNGRTNDILGKSAAKGGAVGTLLQGVCTVYRLAYMAEAAIKAYHAAQLVRFALMFFQAADQIKYGKGDGDRVTYLANNLTWYDKNKPKSEGGQMNFSDSEGYQIAALGDTNGLKEFSQRFLLGGSIGQRINDFTGAFEDNVDKVPLLPGDNGREKMRHVCRTVQSPIAIVGTACAGLIPALTAGGTIAPVIGNIIGLVGGTAMCACTAVGLIPFYDKIPDIAWDVLGAFPGGDQATICKDAEDAAKRAMDLLIKFAQSEKVQEWVLNVLSEIHVDDNTRGVEAGNTIAAGAGMMLSVAGTGYGLKPAGSKEEVANYIAATQDLEETYIALDKNAARNNPFDAENKYSIVGSIVRAMTPDNPETVQASPFGMFSTIAGIYEGSLKIATGTPTADALYSHPSLLGRADERLDNCKDRTLANIGAIGDTYCSIVGVMSNDEISAARKLAYDPNSQVLSDLITYMTTEQPGDEVAGGTECKPPSVLISGFESTSSCDDDKSKLPSIGDDGTPTPGSQYEMYLKYCTEKREASWGLQYESEMVGSERDQDWFSGKQCMSDSKMLKSFRMWTNYCLQAGTMEGKLNCYSAKSIAATPVAGKGDACSVMNNPNVILINPGTKEGLKELCEKGTATNYCGNQFTVNPLLFDVITANSSKYKIWLNNFGFLKDRSGQCSGQHPLGNAIDINGIEKLDGSGRAGGPDWGGIKYTNPAEVKIIQDYASDWLAFLPFDRGGVGQRGCSQSFNPIFPPGSTGLNGAHFFADSCDHLHIDIRNRGNVNAQ